MRGMQGVLVGNYQEAAKGKIEGIFGEHLNTERRFGEYKKIQKELGEYQENTEKNMRQHAWNIRGVSGNDMGNTRGIVREEYSRNKRGVLNKYLGTVTRGTLRRY